MLKTFEGEQLLERSKSIGARLINGLRRIAEAHSTIGDVRGLGAMVAIELFEEGDLARVHPQSYLDAIFKAAPRAGGVLRLDPDTVMSAGSP